MSAAEKVVSLQTDAAANHAKPEGVGQLIQRDALPQGAWSGLFRNQIRQAILPGLYEALREAIPMLDAAIDIYVMMDGVPVIVGDNEAAVQELNDFARTVMVGDNQVGLSSYVHCIRDEVHEQGFGVSEHLLGPRGIYRLNVADSKAISFARKDDGTLGWYFDPYTQARIPYTPYASDKVAEVLRHRTPINVSAAYFDGKNYVELDRRRSHYLAYRVENSDSYGVSLLRSLPFFSEILLTITNSFKNTWERFGDPSYHLEYKCAARLGDAKDANGDTPLEARRKGLAADLATAVQAKRDGKSADLVTATDKDSSIEVSVIGSDGQEMSAEVPMKVVVEQLAAKLKLPAWLLSRDGGSVQGQAKFQSELLQQGCATRNNIEVTHLDDICATHLRARGITWSDKLVRIEDPFSPHGFRMVRGDWHVEMMRPNLSDIVAKAQAEFMATQSRVQAASAGLSEPGGDPIRITSENADGTKTTTTHNLGRHGPRQQAPHQVCNHLHNALETRPIPNPALDKLESETISGINKLWAGTQASVLGVLALPSPSNAASSNGFTFTDADKQRISELLTQFTADAFAAAGVEMGVMALAYAKAWAQGVIDAYTANSLSGPSGEMNNDSIVSALRGEGDKTFAANLEEKFSPRIWRVLEAGADSGRAPADIARDLNTEFDGMRWKFEQIARSEIAIAHDKAKHGEWKAEIDDGRVEDAWDWIPAPDACPICMAKAAGNPYTLDTLPKVVIDTHPSDRCSTGPAVPS